MAAPGRHRRSNADWYRRDKNTTQSAEMMYLRQKFGNDALAVYDTVIELMIDKDNFKLPFSEILQASYANSCMVKLEDFINIIKEMLREEINFFQIEDKFLTSKTITEDLNRLNEKREKMREISESKKKTSENSISDAETPISDAETSLKTLEMQHTTLHNTTDTLHNSILKGEEESASFANYFFSSNFRTAPKPAERQILEQLVNEFGEEAVKLGGRLMVEQGKESLAYLRVILNNRATGQGKPSSTKSYFENLIPEQQRNNGFMLHWKRWADFRADVMKKPLTEEEAKIQILNLVQWRKRGSDYSKVIDNSISARYPSLYELKPDERKTIL